MKESKATHIRRTELTIHVLFPVLFTSASQARAVNYETHVSRHSLDIPRIAIILSICTRGWSTFAGGLL
jgi:hypothetical protein